MAERHRRTKAGKPKPVTPTRDLGNVDRARTTMRLDWRYVDSEISVYEHTGDVGDVMISRPRGLGAAIQYFARGRVELTKPDGRVEIYSPGESRDTYRDGPRDKGKEYRYRCGDPGSLYYCFVFRYRPRARYRIVTAGAGRPVNVNVPPSKGRTTLVFVISGGIDWRGAPAQDSLVEHVAIEPGDRAAGTTIGETVYLIVE